MLLQWRTHLTLSAVHAAWCLAHLPQTAHRRAESLSEVAEALRLAPQHLGLSSVKLWDELITLAPSEEGIPAYVARVLRNCGKEGDSGQLLEAAVRDCKVSFQRAFPNQLDEMRLRQAPLMALWEAHGPGLLLLIGKFTDPSLLVEHADVLLVQPILDGAGYAHLRANRVHLEAVLTHPNPQLPETVRMGWLLSQLDFERPVYSDLIHANQLRSLAGLAMLPPALLAAQELELTSYSTEAMAEAIRLWNIVRQPTQYDLIAEVLHVWWETYQASRPEWRIALTGLQRMLGEHLDT